ncbi:MAG: hypothetical protein QXP77_02975 [Candidatus Aenigmatarchaeota archaeon]
MEIIEVILKSLKEAFDAKRFLPFFLLYLIFSLISLIFLLPIISRAPSFLANSSSLDFQIFYSCLAGILIAFIATLLINIWFSGALVFDIKMKKGFEKCLNPSKNIYPQIFALCLVISILVLVTFFLREFSFLFQILIDWIFLFAFPAVIIKKDSFDFALGRSFNLVKKNIFTTFSFWALTRFIIFLIFLFSLFISTIVLFPIFYELKDLLYTFSQGVKSYNIVSTSSIVLRNYPILILEAFVVSLFLSLMHVFNLISKTYFFMEIIKKTK